MGIHPAIPFLLLQTVWVVDNDGGPGVNFTDLPPAIAAAADGDVLVVKPGTYNHFTLTGKGLRILGESSSNTFVKAPLLSAGPLVTSIGGIPSNSIVYLSGLRFGDPYGGLAFFPAEYQRVVLSGPTSRVVLSGVVVVGPIGSQDFTLAGPPGPGLLVEEAEVTLVKCSITGLPGKPGTSISLAGPDGSPGLAAREGARVHVVSSTIIGGAGKGVPNLCPAAPPSGGGPGLSVVSVAGSLTWVWIANSSIRGGAEERVGEFSPD